MAKVLRVFSDTSVLFSAVWSDTGASRLIFKLAEAGAIRLLVSRQVLAEADVAVRKKNPDALPDLAMSLEAARVEIVASAGRKNVDEIAPHIGHPGDAQILADVIGAAADYFVTLDREHFLNNRKARSVSKIPIGTPGDFLAWVRARLPLL
jgi:predicted nucleic acid-binding protein